MTKSTVRFIIYEGYEETKLKSELQDLGDLEITQVTEDTVEIKTDKPEEVSDRLKSKTLTYVTG